MGTFDYPIVGAGLYSAVFAQKARVAGRSVSDVDKRLHIAGNVYRREVEGIHVCN